MRPRYFIFLLCFILLIGCSNDDNDVSYQIINVTLSNTDEYNYDMGEFGPEDFAVVDREANNANKSELIYHQGNVTYNYVPNSDYTGFDIVEIVKEKNSSSNLPFITRTTINFTITD